MAKFSETCGITCRKFVSEKERSTSKFDRNTSVFFFRNRIIALKMLNFQGVLPQKETLGATFNETRALSSVKYVAQQGINVPIF